MEGCVLRLAIYPVPGAETLISQTLYPCQLCPGKQQLPILVVTGQNRLKSLLEILYGIHLRKPVLEVADAGAYRFDAG